MNKKVLKILIIMLISLLLIILMMIRVAPIFSAYSDVRNTEEQNPQSVLLEMNSEYLLLFSANSKSYFSNPITYRQKNFNDIGTFTYSDKYEVAIFKIDTHEKISLNTNIHCIYKPVSLPTDVTYQTLEKRNFNVSTFYKHTPLNKDIFLSLYGDSTSTIIRNDSIVLYYLKLVNASLAYDLQGLRNYMIEPNRNLAGFKIPMSILLLKKEKCIYLLIMCPLSKDSYLDKNLLYKILK